VAVVEVSQNLGSDARGRRTGSRTYRVYGVAPAALRSNPSAHGMPAPGSQWEDMTADSLTIATSPTASTAYEATLNYSDNGQFRFPENRDETAETFATSSGGTFDETVDLPLYERRTITVPTLPGDPAIGGYRWVAVKKPITEKRTRYIRRVIVSSVDLAGAIAAFEGQVNNLHTIGGRRYLFIGATFSERDAGVFDFEYTWESDKGTPFPDGAASFAEGPAFPGPYTEFGDPWTPAEGPTAYARPPYSAVEPADNLALTFTTYIRYPDVPNGYQQLVNVGLP
jgi:hypothetical protein